MKGLVSGWLNHPMSWQQKERQTLGFPHRLVFFLRFTVDVIGYKVEAALVELVQVRSIGAEKLP